MPEQSTQSKMGFWSVFSLVVGSQIGSAIFMLPSTLAPFGAISLIGWAISGSGALCIALVFAQLCSRFPKSGGPHVYIQETFGRTAAFFTGWTYWVICWASTTVVVIASIGYLSPLIGMQPPLINLFLAIFLLAGVTLLNLRGVAAAGYIEFFLTLLKIIPLLLIPLCALLFFDSNNFIINASVAHLSFSQLVSKVTLLTLWGFIGVESATTAAESVDNPTKNVPRAVIAGTLCVALLYILNSFAILGSVSGSQLMHSVAPYVDASRVIFGGNWYLIISLIASIICVGSLNAWTLIAGQIIFGLAQDRLVPSFFAVKNKYGAPLWGLIISSILIVPLLIIMSSQTLAQQLLIIIDFSVTAFLFIYALCSGAFLYILAREHSRSWVQYAYGLTSLLFCLWIIYETPFTTIAIATLFVLSGVPIYLSYHRKKI